MNETRRAKSCIAARTVDGAVHDQTFGVLRCGSKAPIVKELRGEHRVDSFEITCKACVAELWQQQDATR